MMYVDDAIHTHPSSLAAIAVGSWCFHMTLTWEMQLLGSLMMRPSMLTWTHISTTQTSCP